MNLNQCVRTACQRIAPTWPLDSFIAVNPFWGHIDRPIENAATSLQLLCGSDLLMAPAYYQEQMSQGQICSEVLDQLAQTHGYSNGQALMNSCLVGSPASGPSLLVTDWLDGLPGRAGQASCREIVTGSISGCCASFFDQGQAVWKAPESANLYAHWRELSRHDFRPSIRSGIQGLPEDPQNLIAQAVEAMELPLEGLDGYFTALLLSCSGWSAWCAYKAWQAGLAAQGSPRVPPAAPPGDPSLEHLLAICLAWDWLFYQSALDRSQSQRWRSNLQRGLAGLSQPDPSPRWLVQQALELSYQRQVSLQLSFIPSSPEPPTLDLQAVFCIDVRSEVYRRALESCSPSIQTLGFAGFFGLPAAYTPLGTSLSRAQLPGLLAPTMSIAESGGTPGLKAARQGRLRRQEQWQSWSGEAVSGFNLVESLGLGYFFKLLAATLGWGRTAPVEQTGLTSAEFQRLQPVLQGLDEAASLQLAAGILRGMSLTQGFAPLVLLVGHGSSSCNNPHASGLDCGACCGQTGEVNCRALVGLLNQPGVRLGLAGLGLTIPQQTTFLAGLHNTTTDQVELFEDGSGVDLSQVRKWLAQASHRARSERAPALGVDLRDVEPLEQAFIKRSRDWSQLRPEWGLANNAGFLAAPRRRSRGLNLGGRCFLHEYDYRQDPQGKVLEQIMTAPLIVAHWINMQYYASVVDNQRWGSGNKVLHNVVGGNLGVFEGSGGDLRVGLPLQSLHDGTKWMHTPQRLSAWFEAPLSSLEKVLEKHPLLRQLVEGRWLYLLGIEPETDQVFRYDCQGGHVQWVPAGRSSTSRYSPVREALHPGTYVAARP